MVRQLLALCAGIAWLAVPGHGTAVIANWDMVPFQVFNGNINVGVVAFHETGVDVEFKVNGTLKARVTDPTYNDRTRVWEYWVIVNAADYADGPVKVTATAFPDGSGHTAHALDTLKLYANSHGTLINNTIKWADADNGNDNTGDGSQGNPYQTIAKAYSLVGAGGTVYLKASQNYALTSHTAKNYQYWTTVAAAPGVTRDQIRIITCSDSYNGRFAENMIHWKNVRLCSNYTGATYYGIYSLEQGHSVWFDSTKIFNNLGMWGGGNEDILGRPNNRSLSYMTDGAISNCLNGDGFSPTFMRNVTIDSIGSDIFRPIDNLTAINVTIRYHDAGTTGAHPDFFQCYDPNDTIRNIILYNVSDYRMGAQGFFGCEENGYQQDVALVNVMLEPLKTVGGIWDPPFSQIGHWLHTLVWHVTIVNMALFLGGGPSGYDHLNVQDCNWAAFCLTGSDTNTSLPNSVIDYNHFTNSMDKPKPMGNHATTGDPKFVDAANDNFHITSTSPCYQSGVPLPGVPVDINGNPYDPVHPDRGAFSSYQVAVPDHGRVSPAVNQMLVGLEGNPAAGGKAGIRLTLDRTQNVRVSILDGQGRAKRTLCNGALDAGSNWLEWDGNDHLGRKLTAGVYYVQVMTAAGAIIRPLVALRVNP